MPEDTASIGAQQLDDSLEAASDHLIHFGGLIRAERQRREWSLTDLAKHTGISKITLHHIEHGRWSLRGLDRDELIRFLGLEQ